jgi:hypothetical protein
MAAAVRRVGEHLSREVAYRGAFTVDGVCGPAGFFPTEINTRAGASLELVQSAIPELPLDLLLRMVAHGEDVDFDEDAFEALVSHCAERHRAVRCRMTCRRADGIADVSRPLRLDGNGWVEAAEHDADVTLSVRSVRDRTIVSVATTPSHRLRTGLSLARAAASAFGYARRTLGVPCDDVEAASVA